MQLSSQIAKHFRELHFGGNWTDVNFRDTLNDISWYQAAEKVYSFNTIAALVFHMNYYVSAALKVLAGEKLDAHDKYSFQEAQITSKEDWENLLDKTWNDAENFSEFIDSMPDEKFWDDFSEKKYGNYYRNIHGIIEHCHYHLGQIVLIKKILLQKNRK